MTEQLKTKLEKTTTNAATPVIPYLFVSYCVCIFPSCIYLVVVFNASKTQFLQLSTRHNLPDNYPLFFNDIKHTRSILY